MEYWNGQEWQEMVMKIVKRSWKERFFTLPWYPWVTTKKVYPEDWVKAKITDDPTNILSNCTYWVRYRSLRGE